MTGETPGRRPDEGPDPGPTKRPGAPIGAPMGALKGARVPPIKVGTVATGGVEFAAAILLGVFAGQWLDRRIGTTPWFVILGVVLGAAAGFYNLYRTLTTVRPHAASRARSTRAESGSASGSARGSTTETDDTDGGAT
jgi:ATP synthase protein I